MPSMTPFDPGSIVLVSFPFTNLRAVKKRPAIIISTRQYNDTHPDIIIIAVTSQIKDEPGKGELFINDWKQAGLARPSVVKPLIATVEKQKVLRVLGKLSQRDGKSLTSVIGSIIFVH